LEKPNRQKSGTMGSTLERTTAFGSPWLPSPITPRLFTAARSAIRRRGTAFENRTGEALLVVTKDTTND
jgi:hypothetical protein